MRSAKEPAVMRALLIEGSQSGRVVLSISGGFAHLSEQEQEYARQITHVMMAKAHWKVMKTDSGMVPFCAMGSMFLNFEMSSRVWVAVPHSQNFSEPPMNALFFSQGRPRQPSPKASEYPNMSQQMEIMDVIATLCRAVDSTFLKPERPAAERDAVSTLEEHNKDLSTLYRGRASQALQARSTHCQGSELCSTRMRARPRMRITVEQDDARQGHHKGECRGGQDPGGIAGVDGHA